MENRTYITQQELDRFLNYLKLSKLWNYYLIIYNLVMSQQPYIEFKKKEVKELLIPEDIPIPKDNPFKLTIRGVNKTLKEYQTRCGIRGVTFSTKLFSRRFIIKGEIFYGILEKQKISYKKGEEGYVYIAKHNHRDPEVSKLLTDKKVGISYDYIKRMESLTLGTVGIEVLKAWKMNKDIIKFMESKIHSKLKERKLIGEWFSDENNDLVELVDNMVMSFTPSEIK